MIKDNQTILEVVYSLSGLSALLLIGVIIQSVRLYHYKKICNALYDDYNNQLAIANEVIVDRDNFRKLSHARQEFINARMEEIKLLKNELVEIHSKKNTPKTISKPVVVSPEVKKKRPPRKPKNNPPTH